jgi:hypothetical protein
LNEKEKHVTKLYFTILIFFTILSVNAQDDSKKKSVTLSPVIEFPNSPSVIPEIPKKIENDPVISAPKIIGDLELPKKEFSMFPQEKFGNPGELYTKKFDKLSEELRPEGYGINAGLKEDAHWGDYRTKSKYIDISYRDHGRVDGDLIRVLVNGDVLKSDVYLTGNFKGFRLEFPENGVYKIAFFAINEGSALPNTAQYRIIDQWGTIITGKIEALSAGIKATVDIIKE